METEQQKELVDLIILRPDWLISVMKVIMELKLSNDVPGVQQKLVSKLAKTGEADIKLLKVCWEKEELLSPPKIDIHHLCLILQAYCLIYPILSIVDSDTNSNSEPAKSTTSSYIIPCKLPPEYKDPRNRKLVDPFTFVFDFIDFLPDEIYHRLICLGLKHAKPPRGYPNVFSSKKCFFQNLKDTNWIMEIDAEKHKLRFSVM